MKELKLTKVAVEGSVVEFFVQESGGSTPLLQRPSFFFEYPPDVDLGSLDRLFFYNLFLGALSGPLRALIEPVVVQLPEAVPEALAELWVNHARAANVSVEPTRPGRLSFDPGLRPADVASPRVGLLLGGGKDSLFAFGVLRELFGIESVIPLSYSYSELGPVQHRERRLKFCENPLQRNTGAEIAPVFTNIRGSLIHRLSLQTGNALYLASVPPIAKHFGLTYVVHANEMNHYWVEERPDGSPFFSNRMTRPEYDRYASMATNQLLGTLFEVINLNFAVSKHSAFRMLSERYADLMPSLFMCESTLEMEKWCGQCWKCFEYIMLCLDSGHPCEIDISTYMQTSPFLHQLIARSRELSGAGVLGDGGNLPWSDEVRGADVHFSTMCHSFNAVRLPDALPRRARLFRRRWPRSRGMTSLDEDSVVALAQLKAWYGNKSYDVFDGYSAGHLKLLDLPFGPAYEDLLSGSLEAVDESHYFLSRDRQVWLRPEIGCSIEDVWAAP